MKLYKKDRSLYFRYDGSKVSVEHYYEDTNNPHVIAEALRAFADKITELCPDRDVSDDWWIQEASVFTRMEGINGTDQRVDERSRVQSTSEQEDGREGNKDTIPNGLQKRGGTPRSRNTNRRARRRLPKQL